MTTTSSSYDQNRAVAYYRAYRYSLHSASLKGNFKMNGARRVIVFCLVTVVLPTILIIIPLYLRNNVFTDVTFEVAESDVLEIGEDISAIFCQEHTVRMNNTFNAYQVDKKPEISNTRKHIRLKKSMRLPDDTLEYWGFFLPKGSIVQLSVCSRYDGSRILVVRGLKNLHTCSLLDHTKKAVPEQFIPDEPGQVRVRFELNVEDEPAAPVVTPTPVAVVTSDSPSLTPSTTPETQVLEDENKGGEVIDDDEVEEDPLQELSPAPPTHANKVRHSRSRNLAENRNFLVKARPRRTANPALPHNLDGKTVHGGVAANQTDDISSASSFEAELLDCYGGNILLKQEFPPSQLCHNVSFLVSNHTSRMTTTHTVTEDGYYYYIFYSDNDLVENDIHAVFDIHKPTYQYANISKNCINETSCTFPVAFLANEIVIVEVPTRDGIENEADDISLLVSVCHPRMSVYIIFPLLVLILILGCAFL